MLKNIEFKNKLKFLFFDKMMESWIVYLGYEASISVHPTLLYIGDWHSPQTPRSSFSANLHQYYLFPQRTSLYVEDIMDFLSFCLNTT